LEGLLILLADDAGPLWLALESFFESLPVKPKWIMLGLAIAVLVAVVVASLKRRK
jgi:hypothetical protein